MNIRMKKENINTTDSQILRFIDSHQSGLTLIELLVVMVIMSILATVGFGQYRTSQIKARDAQRKGDLDNIARALEMYYNDHDSYPDSDSGLLWIDSNGDGTPDENLNWGEPFDTDEVIYMKTLPADPNSSYSYCYESDSGTDYKLYAKLENENDDDYYSVDPVDPDSDGYTCNEDVEYRYGVTSSNASLP